MSLPPNRSSVLLPASNRKFLLYSFFASSLVLAVSFVIQWLVYDDWLHHTGPLHVVGSSIAALITFVVVWFWQRAVEQRERDMVRRFELISRMNDSIRNALQAIECVTYLSNPEATDAVRGAVAIIDAVLREVLTDVQHPSVARTLETRAASVGGNANARSRSEAERI
jgi:hypothetical protein